MPDQKNRLPLAAAALASLIFVLTPAAEAIAPPPAPASSPDSTLPYAHNEQGNIRVARPAPSATLTDQQGNPSPPPPPPPCPADRDGNGAITSADLSLFITEWLSDLGAGTLRADFDGNGCVTSADVSAFVSAWLAALSGGC